MPTGIYIRTIPPWNKGLTKEGDPRVNYNRPTSFKKGHVCWCKGTKGIKKASPSSFKKGHPKPKGAYKFPKRQVGNREGTHIDAQRYVRIFIGNGKYKKEHRFIMEKFLGRTLKPDEWVHHKNRVRNDNRIENLEIVKSNTHFGVVSCPFCEKEFLIK